MKEISKFKEELLNYEHNEESSFLTFIQDLRVQYYEQYITENEQENSIQDFYRKFEIKVKDDIEFLLDKITDKEIEENKKVVLKQLVKQNLPQGIDQVPEYIELQTQMQKWFLSQLTFENLLLKIEFYIPELSEKLLGKVLSSKKKPQNNLRLSQYLKLFGLKSLNFIISNIKLPHSDKSISQVDFAKFLFLIFTSQMSHMNFLKNFMKKDIFNKFTVIPIFFTISEYFKKIVFNKIQLQLSIGQVIIYCKQGSKNIKKYNQFIGTIIQQLETQLNIYMENYNQLNLKKTDSFLRITRILENFLKDEKFIPYDYDELLKKNQINVTEENDVIIIDVHDQLISKKNYY